MPPVLATERALSPRVWEVWASFWHRITQIQLNTTPWQVSYNKVRQWLLSLSPGDYLTSGPNSVSTCFPIGSRVNCTPGASRMVNGWPGALRWA